MKAIERVAIIVCVAEVLRYLCLLSSGFLVDWIGERYDLPTQFAILWVETIPRLIVLLLVNLMVAAWIFADAPRHRISRPVWVVLALTTGVLGLAVYLLRVLLGKYEIGQQPHPTCPACGYDLYGLPRGRCPECGASEAIAGN